MLICQAIHYCIKLVHEKWHTKSGLEFMVVMTTGMITCVLVVMTFIITCVMVVMTINTCALVIMIMNTVYDGI